MFQENPKTTLAAPEAQAIDQVTEKFLNELAELDILYTSTDDADKSKQELRNILSGTDSESLFNFLNHELIKRYWQRSGTPQEVSERQRRLFSVLLTHPTIFTQSKSTFVEGFVSKGFLLENAEGAFIQTLQRGEEGLEVFRPFQAVPVAATEIVAPIPVSQTQIDTPTSIVSPETGAESNAMTYAEVISMLKSSAPIFRMTASNTLGGEGTTANSLSIFPSSKSADSSTDRTLQPMIELIRRQLSSDKKLVDTPCKLGHITFRKDKLYIILHPTLSFAYIGDVNIDNGQRLKLQFIDNVQGNAVGGDYTSDNSIYILEVEPGATITMTAREATVKEGSGNAAKRMDRAQGTQPGSWNYKLVMQDGVLNLVNPDTFAAKSKGELVPDKDRPYWKIQFSPPPQTAP